MIQELVNEMFSTGQLKNVFTDFEICKHYDELKHERKDREEGLLISRINYNINSIIHSLIQFDHYEKGRIQMYVDTNLDEGYEIMAHHESLFNRFKTILRYSYWMYGRITKRSVNDHKEFLQFISLRHETSEEEKKILSLEWYNNIDIALKSILTDGKLKAHARDNIIKFQVYVNEKNSLFKNSTEPVITNENNMFTESAVIWIHSKIYFSTCLLYLLKYLEVLTKYCCISIYGQVDYNYFKQNMVPYHLESHINIKPAENTLGIIRVLSGMPDITLNCLDFGKMVI